MKKTKNLFVIVLALMIVVSATVALTACNDSSQEYNPEERPFSMSISTPDGVFNPFFSTSAYDSQIAGMTQIGMLSTDYLGNIVCGENEPTVVKEYDIDSKSQPGYTNYSFLIKNGIKFSDGHPLTIKDVLFNLYVYLDPAFTGSATIYSTDIVGLKAYRQQQEDPSDESSFEDQFVEDAQKRITNLVKFVTYNYTNTKPDDRGTNLWSSEESLNAAIADVATVAKYFREELNSDWNAINVEDYKDNNITEAWQVFMLNDAQRGELQLKDASGKLVKDSNGNFQLDTEVAKEIWDEEIQPYIQEHPEMAKDDAIKQYCIESVYNDAFKPAKEGEKGILDFDNLNPTNFSQIVKSWGTAAKVLELFTAEEKSKHFSGDMVVPNISGITTEKVTSFNGKALDGEYDVLKIKINGVDPKAIYNFSFTVAPMHYYSNEEYVNAFDGVSNFGLKFGSIDFMNNVINAPSKVGLPLGAGAYKASNASGSGDVTSTTFFNNNMVYYERNTYFETVGKELNNAKIKYVRYKVVESDQIINALTNGDIDFGEPSATTENRDAVQESGLGYATIKTNGYGYVGINPRFVPNINIRRAIIKAMDRALITSNYYKGGLAEIINRPMSTTSWAYPKGVTEYVSENGTSYKFDDTAYDIKKLVTDAGYTDSGNGYWQKDIPGFDKGTDTLNYKFTIAGGSVDHPAYTMFIKAAQILNETGMFNVKVVTSQTALSDLSAGKLEVWAAAWSSTIDPDMYQVYHMDSQASSTSNWGYKQIKAGKNTAYSEEYDLIVRLSEKIDAGRATTDPNERKVIYSDALDLIMELAVEMPTYQRNDMSAYNKDVIDESTLTPEEQRSPYNGLISRIWELNYR